MTTKASSDDVVAQVQGKASVNEISRIISEMQT